MTLSGLLDVDASFQFVNVRDLGLIDSLAKRTPHNVPTFRNRRAN